MPILLLKSEWQVRQYVQFYATPCIEELLRLASPRTNPFSRRLWPGIIGIAALIACTLEPCESMEASILRTESLKNG